MSISDSVAVTFVRQDFSWQLHSQQKRFNFNVAKWNVAIVGQTKSGKSSLVNSLRGLQDKDSDAADVGITETTLQPESYSMPAAASCVLWDMPGGKAVGRQQQEVAAAEARRQWLAKLAGMEQLLYSAQSAQFLDIRKHEAEAFKEKLGRDLAAQTVKLTETVTASTVETAVLTVRQQQVSSTEAAKEETEKAAAAALEAVLAAVPRHRQDLTLLEALDKALEGTKRLSQKRFSESNAAAGVITVDIAKLQQLLQPQAAERNDLAFCKQVMEAAVALRAGLHTRAQVVQLVKAPIFASDPVDLGLLNQSLDVQVTAVALVPASVIDSGQIEAAVKACEAETARVGQDYYSALSASSPTAAKGPAAGKSPAAAKGKPAKEEPAAPAEGSSTRPERIPASLTALQELNSKFLQDLQQQLQDYLAASHKQFRAQVVTVYRLLELVPPIVTAAFTQHQLVAAAAAQQALAAPTEQQHQPLVQQFDGHKKALQPSMAQPSRQSEVTALSSAEQERSAQAIQLGQGHTQAALQLTSLQGPAMRAKLVQLTQLLLRLLDGFVMPADLIGPQRRSLKQLQALALAAAEAGGEAVQGSPAGKAPAAGVKPAAAGKAAPKGLAKDAAADSSRSYLACQWHLPPPLLTLQDMGCISLHAEASRPCSGLLQTSFTSSVDKSSFVVPRTHQRRALQSRLTRCCNNFKGDAPLLTALKARAEAQQAPFYVPGHKRGSRVLDGARQVIGETAFQHDLTELPGLDYLASPTSVIQQAQQLAATSFGADKTWFLVNGSSTGIHAAVMATCGPGDCLVLARNCHQSAFAAAVFADCDTWYVQPHYDEQLGVAHGIHPSSVQQALDAACSAGKRVTAVLVVSPTYFGVCSDISGLAEVCHISNVPLIVDEAHGSHFAFDSAFPQSGLSCGADCVIQSSHKTLSALTQAAMLHIQGDCIDTGRVSRALQLLQSSSPSYLLMASLDGARAHAQQQGIWEEPLRAGQFSTAKLQELDGLQVVSSAYVGTRGIAAVDPLRITVGVQSVGLTGSQVSTILEGEYGVVTELATQQVIVFALGIGTTMSHAEKLIVAFQNLHQKYRDTTALSDELASKRSLPLSQVGSSQAGDHNSLQPSVDMGNSLQLMSLRNAFFANSVRVTRAAAAGRVSAELLCPYPPGVPVAIPGEVLQTETIQLLLRVLVTGGTVTGPSDPTLSTFLVVAD
ncbi:hypothetical protein WJX77_009443 [Trebouxia sp. C0004]